MNQNPAQQPLSIVLKHLREKAGLSLYELARRSGINRSVLARIEAGQTTQPSARSLNRLSRALNVDPEVFYDAVWWQDIDRLLPSPRVYLRSKYRLSDTQIAEIERSLKRVTDEGTSDLDNNFNAERRSP